MKIGRRRLAPGPFGLGALFGLGRAQAAEAEERRVAFHVDENGPKRMNLGLNNAANLTAYYRGRGIPVRIRIVADGPGLHMLRADTSPVQDRVASMALELPELSLAACANTMKAMTR